MRTRPSLERLESRLALSSVRQDGASLLVFDFANAPKLVSVLPTGPGAVSVSLDGGPAQPFAGVGNVSITVGGTGGASVYQGTALPAAIRATDGGGLNVVSKSASTITVAGNGRNVVQDTAGNSTITVSGSGFNDVYGGKGDRISVLGHGTTKVYDILAAASLTVDSHTAHDYLFVGAGTALTDPQAATDTVARFFAAGRTPGAGNLVYDPATQTLYFTADNAGDRAYFRYDAAGMLEVDYTTAAGSFTQTFDPATVRLVTAFGGAGPDDFYNATDKDTVFYGQGGANSLIELPAPGVARPYLTLEKAGGAANGTNYLVSDAAGLNDLNGSATAGATTYLYAPVDSLLNEFRVNFAGDFVYGLRPGDAVVAPPGLTFGVLSS